MAEKTQGTVTLIAPNGVTVSVSESKLVDRLAGGYLLAQEPAAPTRSRVRAKK